MLTGNAGAGAHSLPARERRHPATGDDFEYS
jgi:hypothetical protein